MVEDKNNFDEVRAGIADGLAEGLADVHSKTLSTVASNMRDGKDALGNSWRPITEQTLYSRETRTSSRDALVDTGEFRGDIVSTSEFDAAQLVGVIGTSKKWARAHELGAPEVGIPRRPIFGPAATYASRIMPDTIAGSVDAEIEGAELDSEGF